MRVAILTENFLPKLDGVTRTLATLLEHLDRRGHSAILFGPEGGPQRYANAHVIGVKGPRLPFYPELRALVPLPRFGQRLAQFEPDVVHVAEPMLLGAAGIRWARRMRVPVVASYHTNLSEYCAHFHLGALGEAVWKYRRFLHAQCAITLCPSLSTQRELERRDFPRVTLWSRGVDSTLFGPARRSAAWRRVTTGADDGAIVLYVGRLSLEKNLLSLVDAFKAIEDEQVRLVLVGDGPARPELERVLAGHRATFTGYLRGEALAEAYASSDVFAFPSRTETYGQVVGEAMASGLPVVAFDADGVRDQVESGKTGLLAPAGDTQAFAQAVRSLVARPELRAALGIRARQVAAGRTWERVMDDLLDIYRQVAMPSLAQAA